MDERLLTEYAFTSLVGKTAGVTTVGRSYAAAWKQTAGLAEIRERRTRRGF